MAGIMSAMGTLFFKETFFNDLQLEFLLFLLEKILCILKTLVNISVEAQYKAIYS